MGLGDGTLPGRSRDTALETNVAKGGTLLAEGGQVCSCRMGRGQVCKQGRPVKRDKSSQHHPGYLWDSMGHSHTQRQSQKPGTAGSILDPCVKNLPQGLRAGIRDHAKKAVQALKGLVCICGRAKALG